MSENRIMDKPLPGFYNVIILRSNGHTSRYTFLDLGSARKEARLWSHTFLNIRSARVFLFGKTGKKLPIKL